MYDVQRGKKRTVLEVPENRMVRGLSTAALEKDVLYVAADRIVLAWDKRTKASGLSFSGHSGRVSDVECSADGRMIWSTSLDGTLRSWDARKATCLTSLGVRGLCH